MTEEDLLILRCKTHHDNDAFTALVKLHQGKVRAFLVRLSRSHATADDLAQETFIKAHRKMDSFAGKGSFSGWLFRIAYNCFLEHRRSNLRRNEIGEQYGHEQDLLASNYDDITALQMDLEQAMRQLNPDETAAISLCHGQGFSHQEVSDILKMPLGTVKSNINRGKAKLREILAPVHVQSNQLEQAS